MRSISCHIMPLVINSLGGGHTHTNTHTHTHAYRRLHRNNFKKPGARRPAAGAPGLKTYDKEKGLNVGCFANFCHHCLVNTSAHKHEYCYSLFESWIITGLQIIPQCTKDIARNISYVNTAMNDSKIVLQQYCRLCQVDNWCIIAYVETTTDRRYSKWFCTKDFICSYWIINLFCGNYILSTCYTCCIQATMHFTYKVF